MKAVTIYIGVLGLLSSLATIFWLTQEPDRIAAHVHALTADEIPDLEASIRELNTSLATLNQSFMRLNATLQARKDDER